MFVDPKSITLGKSPSVDPGTTRALLDSKKPSIGEIELTLFENCNIECDFCFHDVKSTVGLSVEEMNSKLPIIRNFMRERKGTVDLMQVNILGGELFQDRWMDKSVELDDYYRLAIDINRIAKQYNFELRIVWVSNFLFKGREKVKHLIDHLRKRNIDTHLIASYDFDGRPLSNRYRDNVEWFGPAYIGSVNLVGTTDSIKVFMQNNDEYFKSLYNKFNIFFDDFIPDKGSDDLVPSDNLIYEWYKFIADNYPKIQPVAALIENDFNEMHCLSLTKLTIFPDNTTSNCRWHRYDQGDFCTTLDLHDNTGMMQNYIDELNCTSCEYFNRCGFRCFTQWDWKNRKKDKGCPMKAFFNYIK